MTDAELLKAAKELMDSDENIRHAVEQHLAEKDLREIVAKAGSVLYLCKEFQHYPGIPDKWSNAKTKTIKEERTGLLLKSQTIRLLCEWIAQKLWDKPVHSVPEPVEQHNGMITFSVCAETLENNHDSGAFEEIWKCLVNSHPDNVELGIMFWLKRIVALQGSTREETVGGLASGGAIDRTGIDVLNAVDEVMTLMNSR